MFGYPCPDCGTEHSAHSVGCEYDGTSIYAIRKAYMDVVSVLADEREKRAVYEVEPGVSFGTLRRLVSAMLVQQPEPEEWRSIHTDCLHELKRLGRVEEDDERGGIFLKKPEERAREVIPQHDPMKTIYEVGPIDGCKDNAVFAMISWCEMIGFDWPQTCAFVEEWFEDTGRWESESWAESSPSELLDDKRHIHEKGLGWKNRAEAAVSVIESRDPERKLDARAAAEKWSEANPTESES